MVEQQVVDDGEWQPERFRPASARAGALDVHVRRSRSVDELGGEAGILNALGRRRRDRQVVPARPEGIDADRGTGGHPFIPPTRAGGRWWSPCRRECRLEARAPRRRAGAMRCGGWAATRGRWPPRPLSVEKGNVDRISHPQRVDGPARSDAAAPPPLERARRPSRPRGARPESVGHPARDSRRARRGRPCAPPPVSSETAQVCMIWIIAGPRMTTNRAGKTHSTSGKTSLMAVLAAASSARCRRLVRSEAACTRRALATEVPKRSVWISMATSELTSEQARCAARAAEGRPLAACQRGSPG